VLSRLVAAMSCNDRELHHGFGLKYLFGVYLVRCDDFNDASLLQTWRMVSDSNGYRFYELGARLNG
jgi:hypothetical protein